MLEHAIRFWKKFLKEEFKDQGAITISDIQMEFMPRKSTIGAIFAVKQLIEKYGIVGKDFFVAFMDL